MPGRPHGPDDQDDATLETALERRARERRALRELEGLYRDADALLAAYRCAASGECCQLAATGLEPFLFPLEKLRLREALEASGRTLPAPRADGACPLLDASGRRCSVYAARPFGCRTYFCARVRPGELPNAALHRLSARLTRLSDELDGPMSPEQIRRWLANRGR